MLRLVGITDYERMFEATNRILSTIDGISQAQVFSIRPRRGAISEETGVDVHYMTGFNRGNLPLRIFYLIYLTRYD